MIESGEFVEHLEVSGNLYGTTAAAIRDVIDGTSMTVMIVEACDKSAVIWTKRRRSTIEPELDGYGFAISSAVLGVGMGLIASQLGAVVQSAVPRFRRGAVARVRPTLAALRGKMMGSGPARMQRCTR